MTIPLGDVDAGVAVKSSTHKQVVSHVNGSPGRKVFTGNGSWQIPDGVHSFKVTLCGGGGGGYHYQWNEADNYYDGGDSPMVSRCISGLDIGTTITVTVGAGGGVGANGGTTSFGTYLSSSGGHGATQSGNGSRGSANFQGGQNGLYHGNDTFVTSGGAPYGGGGSGAVGGTAGIVVIEW